MLDIKPWINVWSTLNKIKHSAFNENCNQNRPTIYYYSIIGKQFSAEENFGQFKFRIIFLDTNNSFNKNYDSIYNL